MNGWKRLLLYAVSGVFLALPELVGELAPVAWMAAAATLASEYLLSFENGRRAYLRAWGRAWAFLYPYGLVTFYWFTELYPLDFVGMDNAGSLAVVLAGFLGLPALQTAVAAFLFVLLRFLLRRCGVNRYPALFPATAAALWCIFEWVQTLTWAGVPWGKLAMGQAGMRAMIQSSSLLGPYFVAFLVMLTNGCLALAWLRRRERRSGRALAALLAAAALFGANTVYGAVRIALRDGNVSDRTLVAAAVQGNISSKEKWSSASLQTTVDRYTSLTKEAAAEGAVLVVWPETAYPYELKTVGTLSAGLSSLSRSCEADLFVGAFDRDGGGALLNVLYLYGKDGTRSDTVYCKRHLVPFGEYVPWRDFFEALVPPLAEISPISDEIKPGSEATVFETDSGTVGALICFDSIYESLARESTAAGAELLVLSTNDSWFGESAALYQHNRDAILRAVENGRYLVRAANTGISTMISDTGAVLAQLAPNETGYVTARVELLQERTLYTTLGDVVLLALGAFLAAEAAVCLICRRKRSGL